MRSGKIPEFKDLSEKMFYSCLRIRLVEERIKELYPSDKIQSPVHLSIGQETVSVACCEAADKDDFLFGTYRSHALYLARGGSLKEFFAELYGKIDGCGSGKAGSMHLCAQELNVMGASAIVASTIPHAVGAALASKIKKDGRVSIAFYGEGATGEGVYHESLNFAARHRLPVIFVCENNKYAIHTATSDVHSFDVVTHASSYGISAETIEDGMDSLAIYKKIHLLREQVKNSGPALVEIRTYRYCSHVGPEDDIPLGYRSIEEVNQWKKKDALIQNKELADRFTKSIKGEIEEAVKFAENSPFPGEKELLKDVK